MAQRPSTANTSRGCSAIKTTVLREVAQVQSDVYRRRVVVVDTSSELGGVGRAPHKAIRATRAPMYGKNRQLEEPICVGDPQEDATIEGIAHAYQMENDSAF